MSKIRSVDGFKIYYKYFNKKSHKTPLVFVHGWICNWTVFKQEINFFRKLGYPVIAIDLRGHGKSDKPKKLEDYSIELMSSDIKQILDGVSRKKCFLIGHSLDGSVAALFGIKYPDICKKIIIIGAPYKNPLILTKIKWLRKNRKIVEKICYFISKNSISEPSFESKLDFSKTKKFSDLYIIFNAFVNTSIHSCFATLNSLFNLNFEKKLDKLKSSTLIIASDNDEIYSPSVERLFSKKIKGKFIIKKGTHTITIKKPREISKIIYDFIKN